MDLSGKDEIAAAPARAGPSNHVFGRIAILSAILLLAVYTAFAVIRIKHDAQLLGAERVQALAVLRGGALAARDVLKREVGQPIDAARTGLAAAGDNAAVAVLTESGLKALAGSALPVDWPMLLSAARASRQEVWQGESGEAHPVLAVVAVTDTPGGRRWIVAVGNKPPAAQEGRVDALLWLLAPLGAAVLLGLLLVTQSRQAETAQQAFLDSEQRFRLAVEAARCGIWEWDLSYDQVSMSDLTGVMLGFKAGGVVDGVAVLNQVWEEDRDKVRTALGAATAYGGFDVSFRTRDPKGGRPVWVDARGQAFGGGPEGFSRIVGVAVDVSEERHAQARAQVAEALLRDAIESVPEAFVLWDSHGRLIMTNRNYATFFALDPAQLRPGAPRDQVTRLAAGAIRREGAPGAVRETEMVDGRWLQISERPTVEGGVVMTAADITTLKTQEEGRRLNEEELQRVVTNLELSQGQLSELARKYESEKVRAESANRAKSEFLANMSHELRTPLNAINGFSEIMIGEMYGPLGDRRYQDYARDIHASGQHLLALINDILDMSKIEAGKMTLRFEPMDLAEVTEDAVRLMRNRAEASGIALNARFPDPLPEVDADYRAIKQILLNLLSNAVKFTPRGGDIVIEAQELRGVLAPRIRITVRDTGIGIAAHDLTRLAQPFEQVENLHSKTTQGTGLGLALTRALVDLHGGDLEIVSTPGEGTAVSFSVPLSHATAGKTVAA